ncbi:hypothetical protein Gasu2_53610 [Galdieria sulphuraria]|nr:hypothetical protein Gasu2_53610 [Galdieria sulphuraria]
MSDKKRSGGKHRYSHKLSKNQNKDVVNENSNKKPTRLETSFKHNFSTDRSEVDPSLDLYFIANDLENLELCGGSFPQLTYTDNIKEEVNQSSTTKVSKDAFVAMDSQSSSRSNSSEDESEASSSQILNPMEALVDYESSDSMDSLSSHKIQQMSEEEALDYIQYLKRKIQRIEQVLQVRSGSSSLRGQKKNSDSKKNLGSKTVAEENSEYEEEEACGRSKSTFFQSHLRKHRIRSRYNLVDDGFDYAMSLTASKKPRRKKQSNAREKGKRGSVLRTFQQIRTFLEADCGRTYTFPSLSRHVRFAIHRYAEACGIHSRSHGREEDSILEEIGLGSDTKQKQKQKKKNGSLRKDSQKAMAAATTYSARGRKELEKSLAATITEDNIGHRMLQTMGWSKGQSLGHPHREETGLKHPLSVVIRPPRAGLVFAVDCKAIPSKWSNLLKNYRGHIVFGTWHFNSIKRNFLEARNVSIKERSNPVIHYCNLYLKFSVAKNMVDTKLQDGASAALWTCRFFLYIVILAFSATIVGLDGRKGDNIWNDALNYKGKIIDFCAYSASSVVEGGDHGACKYVMALASISLILVFFLWLFTFVDALYPVLTKFWFVELGVNVFQTLWWLIGAIVVTVKRPSSSVMDALSLTKDINTIEVDGLLVGDRTSSSGKQQNTGSNNA